MKKQTKVNCEVENCKYNEEKHCCLDELDIGCITDDCEEIDDTICNSFEKNDFDDECFEEEYEDLENEDLEECDDEVEDDEFDNEVELKEDIEKEEYIKIEEES